MAELLEALSNSHHVTKRTFLNFDTDLQNCDSSKKKQEEIQAEGITFSVVLYLLWYISGNKS